MRDHALFFESRSVSTGCGAAGLTCPASATCVNNPSGSVACQCNSGYISDGTSTGCLQGVQCLRAVWRVISTKVTKLEPTWHGKPTYWQLLASKDHKHFISIGKVPRRGKNIHRIEPAGTIFRFMKFARHFQHPQVSRRERALQVSFFCAGVSPLRFWRKILEKMA